MNDPQGKVRQLYKALNGIDRAGQLWHNHYDNSIIQQCFKKIHEITVYVQIRKQVLIQQGTLMIFFLHAQVKML